MTEVFTTQLQRRNARSGSTPLITYYDESRGERVELSGTSFANWVDKTAGLLTDEILVEPGDRVRLTLATTHPAHWITLVWVAASWRARCAVTLDRDDDAAVEVVGPDARSTPTQTTATQTTAVQTIACSLHPLGLGFSTPLPPGVLDYGTEVRSHPDVFTGPHPAPSDSAWLDADRLLTQSDVVARTADAPLRRLVTPGPEDPAWTVVERTLVEPVVTGGSAVIVVGASATRLEAIAVAEQCVGSGPERS